ncbi:MAG: zinc-dependent metalloprotease [Bacteroidota bacterium]
MRQFYKLDIEWVILIIFFFLAPLFKSFGQDALFTQKGRLIQVNEVALRNYLKEARLNYTAKNRLDGLPITIPTPLGEQVFYFFKTRVIHPEMELENPQIRTYKGIASNGIHQIRLELVSSGVNAMLMNGSELLFLKPKEGAFQWKKFEGSPSKLACHITDHEHQPNRKKNLLNGFEGSLLKYRLAMSVSGEYTRFFGGNIINTLEHITSVMNRLNAIFERDLGITLELVRDNRFIIYDNPFTDPFDFSGNNQTVQNQNSLDDNIGNSNYDIGHVIHFDQETEGDGFGSIGSVCLDDRKGRGFTTVNDPLDDFQIIDFLAHELGHQLGGNHTFSRCSDIFVGRLPFEPGSGSTIMGYGGLSICDTDNFVEHSSPYFHGANIEEMVNYNRNQVGCAEIIAFDNTAPIINTNQLSWTIPPATSFELDADVVDMEDDSLTYTWEQMDSLVALPLGTIDVGSPLFRSLPPIDFSARSLPSIGSQLSSRFLPQEQIASFPTTINARLTVRDNNPSGSAVSWQDFQLNVTGSSGAFVITEPQFTTSWEIGSQQIISWNEVGTAQSPYNTPLVDILFVTDTLGREQFPIALELPNNGFAVVEIPSSLANKTGSVKVKGHNNVFFSMTPFLIDITGNATSTAELEYENDLVKVFPNPSDGRFKVEVEGEGRIIEVELLDIGGRVVKGAINNGHYNFENLNSGIYLLRSMIELKSEVKVFINKVVIR